VIKRFFDGGSGVFQNVIVQNDKAQSGFP
jgi:hypothetical protein